MRTVQILGLAPNLVDTPDVQPDQERWCSNVPRSYRLKGLSKALTTYTRWFNMHSLNHIRNRYPSAINWYRTQEKVIYLQQAQPDIPCSATFPRQAVQDYFSINGEPNKFFTCSVSWQLAFAIMEGFERIELWGFELRRDHQYDWERPCFFYWIEQARTRGVEVYLPPDVEVTAPGDPLTYSGPLYGYEPHTDFYRKFF